MLQKNDYNTNGMCFIKNSSKRTNGYNDCTIREFSILQKAVGTKGGASAVAGLVFLYIFLALILSLCFVVCGVSIIDRDGEIEWREVFCCCCKDRESNLTVGIIND